MKHVVMFSGGVGSWATAKRVADAHGTDNLILLFSDTKMEDEDLYRFIHEAAENVGGKLVTLTEGRTPWEVFFDVRFLGNSRIDPCSRILKREFLRKHIDENYDPEHTTIYLGIDWTEQHRIKNAKRHWKPWRVEAPMCDAPLMQKPQMLDWLRSEGIVPPRLYAMGFAHNNCGGFCIKAGQGHFKLLLDALPERYAYHEEQERRIRKELGKDVTILRIMKNGKSRNVTLEEFRKMVKCGDQIDLFDLGGCGCFSPTETEE